MNLQRWNYFLSIERDFVNTLEFVELDDANASTFSDAFAKLLLLIGSEVDVVAKMLCESVAPTTKAKNIVDYRDVLTGHFPGIATVEMDIPKFRTSRRPWESWGASPSASPVWWTAYNDIKHERDKHIPKASQGNVLCALCGLMALLLYLYPEDQDFRTYPQLLDYDLGPTSFQ